jgi:hypothetical protein
MLFLSCLDGPFGRLVRFAGQIAESRPTVHRIYDGPPAGPGHADRIEIIEGRVKGALPQQRIVLSAQNGGFWWVQPLVSQPFTDIRPDSRWKGMTHPGTAYAALLVDSRYVPSAKIVELAEKGGPVLAVATVNPTPPPPHEDKEIQFSEYPWGVPDNGRQ